MGSVFRASNTFGYLSQPSLPRQLLYPLPTAQKCSTGGFKISKKYIQNTLLLSEEAVYHRKSWTLIADIIQKGGRVGTHLQPVILHGRCWRGLSPATHGSPPKKGSC